MRFVLLALALPVVAGAQVSDSLSLAGRNTLMVGIGLTGVRDASATPGQASTHTTGEVGSFGFSRWIRPQVAITVSAAVLDADTHAGNGRASNNAIMPILFGLSYAPRALALTQSIRPFVSVAAGPYIHTMNDAGGGSATSYTESVAGARVAAGANWFVARHFTMSLEGAYHTVGKYDRQDMLSRDPSGFAISAGFGFSWGR